MQRSIAIITNPAAGKKDNILAIINEVLPPNQYRWDLLITKQAGDAKLFAQQTLKKHYDIIAVHGGDGTVTDVASVLAKQAIPLAIIPGGTANIVAKELKIPLEVTKAILLLKEKTVHTVAVDMGEANGTPFLNRLEIGVLAKMILEVNASSKKRYGQFAYTIEAVKQFIHTPTASFIIVVDATPYTFNARSIIIANTGNLGNSKLALNPLIDITDGLLDVIVIGHSRFKAFFSWFKTQFDNSSPSGHLYHLQAKNITIKYKQPQKIIMDDEELQADSLTLRVLPNVLTIVVPKAD